MTGDAPARQRFAVARTLAGRMRAPALGLLIALTGVLAACSAKPDDAARRPALYVLAGTQGQPSALLTLSADGGKTLSRTALRQAGASVMALGDDGRLWVGGRSVSGLPLTSITVLDPATMDYRIATVKQRMGPSDMSGNRYATLTAVPEKTQFTTWVSPSLRRAS